MESFATVVEMAEKCRNDAFLASPYVSSTPLMAVLDRIDSDVPIVFVSSFNPEDFLSGSFERSALVALWTDKRVIVLRCPRLHAKYFRLDNDVFVGSANLTNSGMGLASNSNIEILIKPRNTFNSRVFEDLLEIRSTRLSESEYNYLIGITPQPKGQGGGLSGFLNEDEVPDLWFPRSPEASWLWESAALPMEEFSVDQHADITALGLRPSWLPTAGVLAARMSISRNPVVRKIRDSVQSSFRFGEIRRWTRDFMDPNDDVDLYSRNLYVWLTSLYPSEFTTDRPRYSQVLYRRPMSKAEVDVGED